MLAGTMMPTTRAASPKNLKIGFLEAASRTRSMSLVRLRFSDENWNSSQKATAVRALASSQY
jgi:hypothetical protein